MRWNFPPSDKIENCPAQFLAVCWIVHVEFKLHRLRDRFSEGNALLRRANRFQRSSAMTSIRLETEFLKEHQAFVEEQRKVEQQQKEIDALKTELKEQRALIEKVNDKMELKASTSQTTASNQ